MRQMSTEKIRSFLLAGARTATRVLASASTMRRLRMHLCLIEGTATIIDDLESFQYLATQITGRYTGRISPIRMASATAFPANCWCA